MVRVRRKRPSASVERARGQRPSEDCTITRAPSTGLPSGPSTRPWRTPVGCLAAGRVGVIVFEAVPCAPARAPNRRRAASNPPAYLRMHSVFISMDLLGWVAASIVTPPCASVIRQAARVQRMSLPGHVSGAALQFRIQLQLLNHLVQFGLGLLALLFQAGLFLA